MIRDDFRVMLVDLTTGRGTIESFPDRDRWVGGSGLAAGLFQEHGRPDLPWDAPEQPLIFAIGPLTGYFPLMSKTVCAFKSPYHDQYAESHAGGRSALALRFADLDALVITGRAERLTCLSVGMRQMTLDDVQYLEGKDVFTTGKILRKSKNSGASGHRSLLRIGPAGERKVAYACINADSYRHFGRLGSGAVMGAKNLKAISINGDGSFKLPDGKEYTKLFGKIYEQLTATDMMRKYHDLGTAANLSGLDGQKMLPWKNLQSTSEPDIIDNVSGEKFADDTLLRNAACSGCPVGCIHVGFVREKFMEPNQYLYRQVPYDYEPIFSTGTMLGMDNPFEILAIMDTVEQVGLDVMSAGVALAWATEATEKGLISEKETIVPLKFGEVEPYQKAMEYLGTAANEFYRVLGQGALVAGEEYGGEEFACVLGQEMAGYATGEVFFVSEALGFRHSHLDSGGYSYDQKHDEKDVDKAVNFMVDDERDRIMLTSMCSCLFARGVYKEEVVKELLSTVGYESLAENYESISQSLHRERWATRVATGYDPSEVKIPKRYTEVKTWRGQVDAEYMESLRVEYARRIKDLAAEAPSRSEDKES